MLSLDEFLTLSLNGSQLLYLDGIAWTATHTATWLPLVLVLLYIIIRNNDLRGIFSIILCIALCITLADQMASTVFKPLVGRFRPTNDPSLMYTIDVVNSYRGGRYGFFSSHAANTMAVATFLALLIRNRTLTFWLYSWAMLNCWTRVYLGVHYVGDLTVGTIWGCFVGWAVYALWKRYMPASVRIRTELTSKRQGMTATGYSTAHAHLLALAIAITYVFIAFKALFFA